MRAFVIFVLALIAQVGNFVVHATESEARTLKSYDYPNLYDESIPMLWASRLIYSFAVLLEAGREGKLDLRDSFPPEVLEVYKDKQLDVRDLDGGKGLSFNKVVKIIKANEENLKKIESEWEYVGEIIKKIQAIEDADKSFEQIYLQTFHSIDEATQCVYGVLQDHKYKRVTVVFRGSTDLSTRDWQTNLSAQLEDMKTPNLLVDRLKGSLKNTVLVHRGFYNYIFNNKRAKFEQRYDMILADIKPFVEKGYKVYVTGHSLGRYENSWQLTQVYFYFYSHALSSLFDFRCRVELPSCLQTGWI